MNYLSVENISKSYGERTFEKSLLGLVKTRNCLYSQKNEKTTIMSIINGLDESDTGQVVLRKGIKMAFLSQNNNLQDELTEKVFSPQIMKR
jgi:ATP-binding cassette subfamily F protein uup